MTIKDKLIELQIDIEKNKQLVDDVKKALTDAGENATKITNKLTSDGEKIVQALINKSKVNMPKKSVLRPTTIKVGRDDTNDKETDKKVTSDAEESNNVAKTSQIDNNNTRTEQPTKPFWEGSTGDNLKINIKGRTKEVKKTTDSPNGRPLPQSTIDELKRKSEENKKKINDTEGKNDNIKISIHQGGGKNFQQNNKFSNNGQQNRNQQNRNQQNKNQQNKFNKDRNFQKPKASNFDGGNIKSTFNLSNASIATGTNINFTGKKKKENKYTKDNEKQKQNKKGGKDKFEKYNKNLLTYDGEEKVRTKTKSGAGAFQKPEPKIEKPEDEIKSIVIPEVITIKDLAAKLKMQPAVIVKKLFLTGKIVNVNTELSYEEAENIAVEYDILCEKEVKVDVIAELLKEQDENPNDLLPRPPVVVVMGHVDHGKTSILDTIRNTNVIAKEAGGITQHIGAYQVKVKDRLITFLDTPGHEAFTAMRLRGAKSTDIAILVVAADDGVKPQTIEAINHAKAANVEIIVAINKIDKPEANVERVKQQLSEYELVPADWGGQTTYCEVSAKKNIGIDNLLEMILLTADVMDLKANPNRNARGIVIESLLDKVKDL